MSPAVPRSVNGVAPIPLGAGCNNRCVFCALGDARRTAVAPTDASVLAALDAASGPAVAFVGGEPTVHSGLPGWIRAARDRFDVVSVQTNGRRLAITDYARSLVDAGLTHVEVSLQGHEDAAHDYHTHTERSFRQTAKGLLNLRDAPVVVGVATVITRSNFRHLEAIAELARRVGATAWRATPAVAVGRAADQPDRLLPNPAMVAPRLERAELRFGPNAKDEFPFAGIA